MSNYYDEYRNSYYNPDDVEEQPGDNQNWKLIQKGFKNLQKEINIRKYKYNVESLNSAGITIPANSYQTIGVTVTHANLARMADGTYEYNMVTKVTLPDTTTMETSLSIGESYIKFDRPSGAVYMSGTFEKSTAADIGAIIFERRIYNNTNEDITLPARSVHTIVKIKPFV